MDLSGNAIEFVVNVGTSAGRAFTGSHGDGVLTTLSAYEGYATNTDWPGCTDANHGIYGTLSAGAGLRGAVAVFTAGGEVSNRYAINRPDCYPTYTGIRLCRTG